VVFLTAASCPKKDFYTPELHTQYSASFVLHTQKSTPKSRPKKVGKKVAKKVARKRQERWQKSLFLNLSCCCLETGLKPFLFMLCLNLSYARRNIGLKISWDREKETISHIIKFVSYFVPSIMS